MVGRLLVVHVNITVGDFGSATMCTIAYIRTSAMTRCINSAFSGGWTFFHELGRPFFLLLRFFPFISFSLFFLFLERDCLLCAICDMWLRAWPITTYHETLDVSSQFCFFFLKMCADLGRSWVWKLFPFAWTSSAKDRAAWSLSAMLTAASTYSHSSRCEALFVIGRNIQSWTECQVSQPTTSSSPMRWELMFVQHNLRFTSLVSKWTLKKEREAFFSDTP